MDKDLKNIIVCPICHTSLKEETASITCKNGHIFPYLEKVPRLVDSSVKEDKSWLSRQELGLEDYENPDEEYLALSDSIARLFGEFCNFRGKILDVGCGISANLSYVKKSVYKNSLYVGVDPFLGESGKRDYHFVQALGEELPFKNNTFDQVVFATSLDHVVDAGRVIEESSRVLKTDGEILIWTTIFEVTPQSDISVYRWLRMSLYYLKKRQVPNFLLSLWYPYRLKYFGYKPTDAYHFYRFTRKQIVELFTTRRLRVSDYVIVQDRQNDMSKHMFLKAVKHRV